MIPTARNFYLYATNIDYIENYMIAFAKMHVAEALRQVSQESRIIDHVATEDDDRVYKEISVDSILNAYPLTNIK